jgi:hypothetical protein
MKTPHFERGSYLVFDTSTWDAVRKDNFVVSSPADQIKSRPCALMVPDKVCPVQFPVLLQQPVNCEAEAVDYRYFLLQRF